MQNPGFNAALPLNKLNTSVMDKNLTTLLPEDQCHSSTAWAALYSHLQGSPIKTAAAKNKDLEKFLIFFKYHEIYN